MELFDSSLTEPLEMRMIRLSPFEVRQKIDKNSAEFRSLVNSIQEHGLLQPILVRPISHGFEIVAGYRRFEACKTLRWRFIQCKIQDLSDKQTYEIQLTENIQRKSLDPIEEAEAFKRYVDEFGWGGVAELAKKIQKSEEYVSHRMQLLKLPADAKQQLIQKAMNVSQGLELLGIPPESQSDIIQRVVEKKLTVRQIRQLKSENAQTSTYNNELTPAQKVAKKTALALRVTLSRIDSLIDEAHNISDKKSRDELIAYLMDIRYNIHDMVDKTLKIQKNKKI